MEKIKPRLYQLTIALSLISLILALVSSGKQREFFYIAIYVSIIGLAFEYKKITLRPFTIALPILLIGLLNLGWYLLYEYHNEGLNLYSDYLGASKKLILASVLIFYIDRFKFYIDKDTFRKFFFFATALGFVLATGYGLWQASQGMTRVEMAINRATVSAYVYSVLSLAFVYSLYLQQNVKLYVVAGFTILISYFVILLTGTRAAMGLYLLLAIVLTLYHFRKIHLKSTLIFLCIVAGIVIVSYKPLISPKIRQTQIEVEKYQQGYDRTSLGARFSMWTVGIENGLAHPLGQSLEDRETWTRQYIKDGHPHLATALVYIKVHLHNEFIEKYSLQGIPGVAVMLFFFVSMIVYALRNRNALLLTSMLLLLLYGLTDVILLSSEALIFFMILFALSTPFSQTKQQ
ncbi:O-antigen ligase [Enterobacter cloacae]|jgi:Lipid A core - O-antigen ligase and related enzymes|uniref:O-antigen ligase family protein n=1 Tax=Enterobacter TaxID=547 RepID=UPI0004481E1E|nr:MULTISPECIES: O-antigen ligase family protein [Enterobacter]AWS80039.1 O-antigen ligase family protein [Enterobacter cloacae complex sp.]AXO44987.1 O-antigen ligase family protein [Enterobacter hormaechei]EHN8910166.1 O-antigen ligase family protein [Enterobacter hormaechei]EKJ6980066.1 O-antigen ligase family protein [Enterobacter hormaechei]EKK5553410.1 O-antigen ligase family protein [Enterobacter hormaechei]